MTIDLNKLCSSLRESRTETIANRKMLPKIRDVIKESGVQSILQPSDVGGSGGL